MKLDLFMAEPRWKILELISKKPLSPIQISTELGTSVAYISQQLKLLETASLIKKEKTGSAEKGAPRSLYSISKDFFYMTVLTKDFSAKNLLDLTESQKIMVKIWLLNNPLLIKTIEKIYRVIEDDIDEISEIFIDLEAKKQKLTIITDSEKVKSKLTPISKVYSQILDISVVSNSKIKSQGIEPLYKIYSKNIFSNEKEMKGGKIK
jgi:predicted transcriptional regulator